MKGRGYPDPAKPKSIDRRELNVIEAARGKERLKRAEPRRPAKEGPAFAELVAATHFSFLRGASHASDMVAQAIHLGLTGLGIADRNSVAGVVRAHVARKRAPELAKARLLEAKKEAGQPLGLTEEEEQACKTDLRLIVGARLVFADGTPDIVAYPSTRRGWGELTKLLTKGNLKSVKGDCILSYEELTAYLDDLLLIVLPYSTATEQTAHRRPVAYEYDERPSKEAIRQGHLSLVPPPRPADPAVPFGAGPHMAGRCASAGWA
jgi:error-prone DNA polymerase